MCFSCYCVYVSLSILVPDSRDRQGNVWLPYNLAMLAVFKILFAAKLAAKLDWSDTLSKLRIYTLEVM